MTSNDSDLLPRLQAGEPLAQQELFQRCQQRLRPFFSRKLSNFSDVEDCLSEVITRALEGIRNGQQPEVLDAWITGIAHNVLKARYAEDKRRDAREIPADLPQGPTDPRLELEPTVRPDEDLPNLPSDWEFLLGKRELWSMVRAAIDGINPKLRPIMRAHYELSVERNHTVIGAELADALQMPTKSVDHELHRARRSTLEAIAALVLARTGRDNCAELAQQLDTILSAEQQQAQTSGSRVAVTVEC